MQQQVALRSPIQSLLRRNGFNYKAKTQRKTLSPSTLPLPIVVYVG